MLSNIKKDLEKVGGSLVDMEWRLFKEWQRVIPSEPFYAYKYSSVLKRALKENIKTDNLFEANV